MTPWYAEAPRPPPGAVVHGLPTFVCSGLGTLQTLGSSNLRSELEGCEAEVEEVGAEGFGSVEGFRSPGFSASGPGSESC